MSTYAQTWRRRHEARVARREALRQAALAALPALSELLVELGATRVIAYGSTVNGDVSDEPDIDLYVEGLAPEVVGHAVGRLFLAAPLPVDLLVPGSGRPEIEARARAEGLVLHG